MHRLQTLTTAIVALLLLFAALASHAGQGSKSGGSGDPLRFRPVDVWVETGDKPLAAYQLEIRYDPAEAHLVGVEGGEGVFAEPPYYDPKGLTGGRIVLAAFTTSPPPSGRVRVARLHLAIRIGVDWIPLSSRLEIAAGPDAEPYPANLTLTWTGE